MYRISDELAKKILSSIKNPEVISSGENAFTYTSKNSIGIIDPTCAIGTDFLYSLECPTPVIYPEFPFIPTLKGYFLYRREELGAADEPWEIERALIDPGTDDYEEKMDVSDCAVILPSDIDKLVAPTISTMEQLIAKEPLIIDCLNLDQK